MPPKAKNPASAQLRRWSYTFAFEDDAKFDDAAFAKKLKNNGAIKWCFQEEKGAGGLRHLQGCASFKTGKRLSELSPIRFPGLKPAHWSATHDDTAASFYSTKEESRIRGPWSDKDQPAYIPIAFRDPVIRAEQQWILDRLEDQNNRKILFIVDRAGNSGKTWLGMYLCLHRRGVRIPSSMKSAQEIIQAAMATLGSTPAEQRYLSLDIPRSVSGHDSWIKWLSALEDIKNGHLCDPRYQWKECFIEPPRMMVTSNQRPPQDLLTSDRFDIVDMLWIKFASGVLSQEEYRQQKAEQKERDEERKEQRRARTTANKATVQEEEEDEEGDSVCVDRCVGWWEFTDTKAMEKEIARLTAKVAVMEKEVAKWGV